VAEVAAQSGLTSLSHGAGCACKIGPDELAAVRDMLPASAPDPDLLVGLDPADDAAVYRITPEVALVQTIDFFTPIVDDPFDFGRIAAANALSDVYAMGAEPRFALNVVAFSLEALGPDVLGRILAGGAETAAEAGIAIAGGHSIDDPEPKYGMTVTGVVHPDRILTKSGGRPGDDLYLTKPLGGGLVTTAAKRGIAGPELVARAVEVMTTLNRAAAEEAQAAGAAAMTDVTGFGLIGHLGELCRASGVSALIDAEAVPAIDGALEVAADPRCVAGGSRRNAAHAAGFTSWDERVPDERRVLLTDAMTSGGLLLAARAGTSGAPGVRIGSLTDGRAGAVEVQ
jgi:selenide, water dikinase